MTEVTAKEIIELREYLEEFIKRFKGKKLHMLDISEHLSEIRRFGIKSRTTIPFKDNSQKLSTKKGCGKSILNGRKCGWELGGNKLLCEECSPTKTSKKIIKCPMKIKNVFPYGEVPVVDSEKLKELISSSQALPKSLGLKGKKEEQN